MHIIGLALALVSLIAFPPPMAHAQLASGTDCGCAKTGPFVDPDPGKAPFINAGGDSAASSPKYRLTAIPGGPNLPANIAVVRLADGATALQTTGLFWGFSPDQDRFLIWSQTGSVFLATLYNLTGITPAAPLRTFSGAFTSLRFRFGKDGRFLLMAGLINGGTQVQLEYVNAATGDPRLITTLPIPTTGTIDGDSDVAGWGFGPDSSRIVYSYLSGSQPMVAMDNLGDASQAPLVQRQLGASAFWQFSACGDVFGIVNQTAASQAQVDLWSTRDGSSSGSTAFASLDVSLTTTATQHQASIPSTTVDLAANGAGTACVNAAPTADFSTSGILEAGRTITFTDSSSDTDGAIASWNWTFGDGGTSSLQNPTHVYATGSAYNAALTVTDNGGKTASRTKAIPICSAAVASGGKLLYRTGNISGDLYALNMDGSGTVRITNSDQMYKGQVGDGSADADYSPDGLKIAWIAAEQNGFVGSGAGLAVSNADGSNKRVLLPYINDFMTISFPRWTPDGRSVAFYLRDIYTAPPRHGIYLIDADGSNMRLVHQAVENSANQTAQIAYPGGFSPVSLPSCSGDGCWTLAVQYNTRGASYNNSQIWRIQGSGTGFARIVTGTADHAPRFSPDGTKIAFIRGWSPEVLYVMNSDGTGAVPVGTHPSNTWDSNPIWSPDGTQLAYTRTFYPTAGSTQRDIVVTNADGCHGDAVAVGSPYKNALSWAAGSAAQGLGSISGHVYFGGNTLTAPSTAGIAVTAYWSGGSRNGQTDADGNYRITEIPAGVNITSISASFAGYVWTWPGPIAGFTGYQFTGFTGHAYGLFLGMQPDRFTLKGTVRDKDGNPVPGITIEASGQPAPVAPVMTGSDGSFSLDLRPRSSYTVKPATAGYDYMPLSASAWGDYGAVLTQDFTAELIVPTKGDLNGDRLVDMTDAVLALQVIAGMNPDGILANYASSGVDVNGDGRLSLEEVIFIMQTAAELR
jgi:PKD repeat protein